MSKELPLTIRALIFDFDGTLADTLPVCCAAFRDVLPPRDGRAWRDDEIMALFGPNEEGILQRLLGDEWRPAFERFLVAYERAHDACDGLFPGVAALLDELLARDIPLAIVTGKGPGSAAISARLLGLARYFPIVESGSPQGIVKADAMREIVARWRLAPEEVAYVGDTAYDMRATRAAGLVAVAAAWAETAEHEALCREQPDAWFNSVERFAGWLRERLDG